MGLALSRCRVPKAISNPSSWGAFDVEVDWSFRPRHQGFVA